MSGKQEEQVSLGMYQLPDKHKDRDNETCRMRTNKCNINLSRIKVLENHQVLAIEEVRDIQHLIVECLFKR